MTGKLVRTFVTALLISTGFTYSFVQPSQLVAAPVLDASPAINAIALRSSTGAQTANQQTTVHTNTPPTLGTRTPIRHLVIIVQENHSFDNYFGTYPNAVGFKPLAGTPVVDGLPAGAYNLGPNGQRYTPFTLSAAQSIIVAPPHGYFDMIKDYNDGKMSGFVTESAAYLNKYHVHGFVGGPMGHYSYSTIGPYWDYAQHYALADHWFQAVMGPTTTNVMYLIAARAGQNYHNVYYTSPPTKNFDFNFTNIGDVMSAHHVSWKWYQGQSTTSKVPIMDNPFMFFRNYRLGYYQGHMADLTKFDIALKQGQLPAVSFLKPNGQDEHPGTNIELGVQYVTNTVNQIMKSKYWDSTAIILTYDESGGWYDHVAPPQTDLNVDGLQGDGPRVPTLIISPYSKQNFVSHQIYDTTSILRFMEYNWNLPALNEKDKNANNLISFFDFSKPHDTPYLIRDKTAATSTVFIKSRIKIVKWKLKAPQFTKFKIIR